MALFFQHPKNYLKRTEKPFHDTVAPFGSGSIREIPGSSGLPRSGSTRVLDDAAVDNVAACRRQSGFAVGATALQVQERGKVDTGSDKRVSEGRQRTRLAYNLGRCSLNFPDFPQNIGKS